MYSYSPYLLHFIAYIKLHFIFNILRYIISQSESCATCDVMREVFLQNATMNNHISKCDTVNLESFGKS